MWQFTIVHRELQKKKQFSFFPPASLFSNAMFSNLIILHVTPNKWIYNNILCEYIFDLAQRSLGPQFRACWFFIDQSFLSKSIPNFLPGSCQLVSCFLLCLWQVQSHTAFHHFKRSCRDFLYLVTLIVSPFLMLLSAGSHFSTRSSKQLLIFEAHHWLCPNYLTFLS